MTIQYKVGNLWIGYAETSEIFYDFFKETYDEEGISPLNKFIESQGGRWYDHDWVERIFHGDVPKNAVLDTFLNYLCQHYTSEEEVKRLKRKAQEILPSAPNCTVTFFEGADVPDPREVFASGLWLKFLGTFNYQMKF